MEFIELKSFEKNFKKAGLTDEDMRKLQSDIIRNPDIGDVEEETHGLRKLRLASVGGKGKSGGSRIHYVIIDNVCYFIAFVPKNVAENLSKSERNNIAKFIRKLKNIKEQFISLEGTRMGNKTSYDYIMEGLTELQDYLEGDKSKGKKCTMKQLEPSFAESSKKSIKLRIKEDNHRKE